MSATGQTSLNRLPAAQIGISTTHARAAVFDSASSRYSALEGVSWSGGRVLQGRVRLDLSAARLHPRTGGTAWSGSYIARYCARMTLRVFGPPGPHMGNGHIATTSQFRRLGRAR
ncbi:hypothetical protein C8Q73DRAFT_340874 [Cubamyces lactineus]|nr:hypothetical protein C8Q73DRAFT_340874 [Cubamyces lactineus]